MLPDRDEDSVESKLKEVFGAPHCHIYNEKKRETDGSVSMGAKRSRLVFRKKLSAGS